MSDEEEPYANLDLDTAEALLIAAGKPELAKALYHQAQGVRNLVQGEWGKSFITSLEGLLVKHINPLTQGQAGILAVSEETARQMGKLALQVGDMGAALDATITRVNVMGEVVSEHAMQIMAHESRILATEKRVTATESRLTVIEAEQIALRREVHNLNAQLTRDKATLRRISQESSGGT